MNPKDFCGRLCKDNYRGYPFRIVIYNGSKLLYYSKHYYRTNKVLNTKILYCNFKYKTIKCLLGFSSPFLE
jgi:hypothetical protein